jgi:hypothetical protein
LSKARTIEPSGNCLETPESPPGKGFELWKRTKKRFRAVGNFFRWIDNFISIPLSTGDRIPFHLINAAWLAIGKGGFEGVKEGRNACSHEFVRQIAG